MFLYKSSLIVNEDIEVKKKKERERERERERGRERGRDEGGKGNKMKMNTDLAVTFKIHYGCLHILSTLGDVYLLLLPYTVFQC